MCVCVLYTDMVCVCAFIHIYIYIHIVGMMMYDVSSSAEAGPSHHRRHETWIDLEDMALASPFGMRRFPWSNESCGNVRLEWIGGIMNEITEIMIIFWLRPQGHRSLFWVCPLYLGIKSTWTKSRWTVIDLVKHDNPCLLHSDWREDDPMMAFHEICIPEKQHHWAASLLSETFWDNWSSISPLNVTSGSSAEYLWLDLLEIKDDGDMWCLKLNRLQYALQMHWSNSKDSWVPDRRGRKLGILCASAHDIESLRGTDKGILGAVSPDMKASHELHDRQVFERQCRERKRERERVKEEDNLLCW